MPTSHRLFKKYTSRKTVHPIRYSSPEIRWFVQADCKRTKVNNDIQHIMNGLQGDTYRFKSRNSFMRSIKCITRNPKEEKIEKWRKQMGGEKAWKMPTENLAPGHTNKWVIWRRLYWLQTKVGRCKVNLKKWGYLEHSSVLCEGSDEQKIYWNTVNVQSHAITIIISVLLVTRHRALLKKQTKCIQSFEIW